MSSLHQDLVHGSGYGYGHSSNSGEGYGYGSGYGDGRSSNSGYGDASFGEKIELPEIGCHDVFYNRTFDLLSIDYQIQTPAYWAEHWRLISEECDIGITEDAIDEMLNIIYEH